MSNLTLGPDEEIQGNEVNQSLLNDVAKKVVKEFTVIPESVLGKPVPDDGDCVWSYAWVLLSLCLSSAAVHGRLEGGRQ